MTKSRKKAGYILIAATLASIVYIMISMAFFTIFSGQFSMISAGRTAMQAQQYADVVANTLKLQSTEDIIAKTGGEIALNDNNKLALNTSSDSETKHDLSDLLGSNDSWTDWQYNISIADGPANSTGDSDDAVVQKIATVRMFKDGDTLPRYSEEIPLSLQGSLSGVPTGAIIAYYGDLNKIPSNFKYCDGTNGTPDLRGRVIVETGAFSDIYGNVTYNLGDVGGERYHQLTLTELPSHNFQTYHAELKLGEYHGFSYPISSDQNDGNIENNYNTNTLGGNQAHNIMQPYIAVHYIMRIK